MHKKFRCTVVVYLLLSLKSMTQPVVRCYNVINMYFAFICLFKKSGLMKAHEKPQETFRSQKFCQGPKLGGDLAWACNAGKVHGNPAMPPASNWQAQNVGWELLDSLSGSRPRVNEIANCNNFRRKKIADGTIAKQKLWRGIPVNLRQLNEFEFGWSSLCIRTCHVHMSVSTSPKVDWQVLCDEKVDDRLRIGPVGREGGNPSC